MRTSVTLAAPLLALMLFGAHAGRAVGETAAAEELLADSIAVHDPDGVWARGAFRLAFEESRPDGSIRQTVVVIDNGRGRFEYASQRDGRKIRGELDAEGCAWSLDGSTGFSDEERERFRLTCERLEWIRNYYVYLWGMPMKLLDRGTVVDPRVEKESFEGRQAWEVRVTYEEEVGSDVWYFYFDPGDRALIGYRFYHDEAANDGEYIVLEGVHEGAGLRLPQRRTWYTHQEDELLGTDTLVGIETLERSP
jgi:hypothetical protein